MLHGVDLSHWQGDVDFKLLRQAGVKFCFLKFTEGTTHIDKRAITYLRDARTQGLPTGAYHYYQPKYHPIDQAEHFLLTMTGHEGREGELMLPTVIDVEVRASSATLRSGILAFCEHVEQARGVTPIIYTSPGFWRSYVGRWDECVRFPLWVAHYGTSYPSQFHPWVRWHFWQYTSAGRMPGIAGNVDLNLFPGTWLDLLKLCKRDQNGEELSPAYDRIQRRSPMVQP